MQGFLNQILSLCAI